ncbi:MAG: hypothetical protein ABIN48_08800 [Ginsengibacter sp.]
MELSYFNYFQYAALISSLIFFKGLRRYQASAMIPLMLVVCIVETLSKILKAYYGFTNNHFLYNIYIVSSTPLYFYMFYNFLDPKGKFKKIYVGVSLSVTILFFYNLFFFEGFFRFNTLAIIFQQFFTTLLSVFLLFRLATSQAYFKLSSHPYFWIAAGILIFSMGTLVVLGLNQYIRINNLTIVNKSLYRAIMPVLNVILYSSFTYAFYLCAQKKKLYLPL